MVMAGVVRGCTGKNTMSCNMAMNSIVMNNVDVSVLGSPVTGGITWMSTDMTGMIIVVVVV